LDQFFVLREEKDPVRTFVDLWGQTPLFTFRTFRDRLHYLHSVLLGTDSIIYIPVIWFFVAELGALFFIHLEQVCRQRFSVRRQERKAGSWVSQDRDPVQKHHGKTEEARKMGQTIGEVAMRRRSSADARPTSAFRDAGLRVFRDRLHYLHFGNIDIRQSERSAVNGSPSSD